MLVSPSNGMLLKLNPEKNPNEMHSKSIYSVSDTLLNIYFWRLKRIRELLKKIFPVEKNGFEIRGANTIRISSSIPFNKEKISFCYSVIIIIIQQKGELSFPAYLIRRSKIFKKFYSFKQVILKMDLIYYLRKL